MPVGCLTTYNLGLTPRVGFAYNFSSAHPTVLRGGYGMFTDIGFSRSPGAVLAYGPRAPYGQAPSVYDVLGYTSVRTGSARPHRFPGRFRRKACVRAFTNSTSPSSTSFRATTSYPSPT